MSDDNSYEGNTAADQERRRRAGTPGYDAFGFEIRDESWKKELAGPGCCVMILGASLAMGSFGVACKFVKDRLRDNMEKDQSQLVVTESPKMSNLDKKPISIKTGIAR